MLDSSGSAGSLISKRQLSPCFLAGASVIAAWGLYLMVMSFYVRADTLAGVIFFFMPVLQWIAGAVLVVICLATKGLGELKE